MKVHSKEFTSAFQSKNKALRKVRRALFFINSFFLPIAGLPGAPCQKILYE